MKRNLLFHSIIILLPLFAGAQQLPEIQGKSRLVPENLKVDGRSGEWGNPEAYNPATSLYYTVANDKNRICFMIQVKDPVIIRKVINGGITLTLNPYGRRDDQSNSSFTFPVIQKQNVTEIADDFSLHKELKSGVGNAEKKQDSLLTHINQILLESGKTISVKNLSGVEDSVLSVYNNQGIRAKMILDEQWTLGCEIVIPLKLLRAPAGSFKTVKYNVMLKGLQQNVKPLTLNTKDMGQVKVYTTPHGLTSSVSSLERSAILFPTDFWAEYSLLP